MTSAPCAVWVMAISKALDLTPAYLLHSRPFSENTLMVDFLTHCQGRIGLIVPLRFKSLCRPFQSLSLAWNGRGEFKKATVVDVDPLPLHLSGRTLFSALYINELVVRLVLRDEPVPEVFCAYQQALQVLQQGGEIEPVLRQFEIQLLDALGYSYDWLHDVRSGELIKENRHYGFLPETGFICQYQVSQNSYPGIDILKIAAADFADKKTRMVAKKIMRQALAPLLGDRPLNSRQLFSANNKV